MAAVGKIGRFVVPRTALLVCDMQEKFRTSISHFNAITTVSSRLIQAAKVLQVPIVITEMYPKGDYNFFFVSFVNPRSLSFK